MMRVLQFTMMLSMYLVVLFGVLGVRREKPSYTKLMAVATIIVIFSAVALIVLSEL